MVVHIVVVRSVNVRGTLWLTVVSNLRVFKRRCQRDDRRGDLNDIVHM
jgi:hypothetical protein